ncbi:MAG: hypothetical protein GVX78_00730 [Bacteroidetes bacterium]|jgi:predicted transposase YdaD|nr:hypothetical protein [Bacteroidota bacterium]
MSKAEQVKYDKYLETFVVSESEINTARYEGKLEGREEGLEEGKTAMILGAYKTGIPVSEIADIADRTEVEVEKILVEHGLPQK